MSLKNFMSYEDATTVIGAVKDAIDSAVSSAYHHAGTKTVAQLTHDLLVAANEGNVYNITDSGTTTSDFIEGIGKTIDEGSNVGICKVGNDYKFDLLSGFVDTTNFVQKSQTAGLLKNDGTVNDEIEDDVDSLKSGLTNVQGDVKLNTQDLTTPSRTKNLLPLTLDRIKSSNTSGTWSGNVYTIGYNTYTVSVDNNGVVTSIEGTSTNIDSSAIRLDFDLKAGSYILSSGFEELFGANDTFLQKDGVTIARGNSSSPGQNFTLSEDSQLTWFFRVTNITKVSYPMIRLSTETDPTFAPYIPSVESRIEAVESNLNNLFSKTYILSWGNYGDLTETEYSTENNLTIGCTLKVVSGTNGRYVNYYQVTGFSTDDVLAIPIGTEIITIKTTANNKVLIRTSNTDIKVRSITQFPNLKF